MICQAHELGHDMAGSFVFLFHHEDRVRNRAEADVCRRTSTDRLLIHLRDERKKDLFFFVNVRVHLATKFLNQLGDVCQFGRSIASVSRDLRGHFSESRKLLANAVVMNADDVLNQAAQRQILWIRAHTAASLGFRVSQFFEHLFDREL